MKHPTHKRCLHSSNRPSKYHLTKQQMQSPYQQLFLLQNRVPVDSVAQPIVQKIKRQISIPQPPTKVRTAIPKIAEVPKPKQLPTVPMKQPSVVETYQSMVDLIRQNQDLKNELVELDKDILNFKSLIEVRAKG